MKNKWIIKMKFSSIFRIYAVGLIILITVTQELNKRMKRIKNNKESPKKTELKIGDGSTMDINNYIAIPFISDMHGAYISDGKYLKQPIVTDKLGGLRGFYKYMKVLKDEFGENLILTVGGDELEDKNRFESLDYFNSENGKSPVDILVDELDVKTVRVLGNHEFDYGGEYLKKAVDNAEGQYICSNVVFNKNSTYKGINLPKYKIVEINGTNIAFVGLVAVGTQYQGPLENNGVIFKNYIEAIDEALKEIKKEAKKKKIDIHRYILLAHEGVVPVKTKTNDLLLKYRDNQLIRNKKMFKDELKNKDLGNYENLSSIYKPDDETTQENMLSLLEFYHNKNNNKPFPFDAVITGHTHKILNDFIKVYDNGKEKDIPFVSAGKWFKNMVIVYIPKYKKSEVYVEGSINLSYDNKDTFHDVNLANIEETENLKDLEEKLKKYQDNVTYNENIMKIFKSEEIKTEDYKHYSSVYNYVFAKNLYDYFTEKKGKDDEEKKNVILFSNYLYGALEFPIFGKEFSKEVLKKLSPQYSLYEMTMDCSQFIKMINHIKNVDSNGLLLFYNNKNNNKGNNIIKKMSEFEDEALFKKSKKCSILSYSFLVPNFRSVLEKYFKFRLTFDSNELKFEEKDKKEYKLGEGDKGDRYLQDVDYKKKVDYFKENFGMKPFYVEFKSSVGGEQDQGNYYHSTRSIYYILKKAICKKSKCKVEDIKKCEEGCSIY